MAYPESMTYDQWAALPLDPAKKAAYHISSFSNDGFTKVCEVVPEIVIGKKTGRTMKHWYYKNINTDLMFSTHRSWIYFIVVDDYVVKIGETAQPLGIPQRRTLPGRELQPITGTESRFGRIRSGDKTDENIRETLDIPATNGQVSLWAKPCDITVQEVMVGGALVKVITSSNKSVEYAYLDYFEEMGGGYPILNKGRK